MKLSRKTTILVMAAIVLIAIFSVWMVVRESDKDTQSGVSNTATNPVVTEEADQDSNVQNESITVTGVVGCLQHTNSDGPQTMECAIGITTDAGNSYGLQSDDPVMTGSVPTGDRITVEGTLVTGAQQYKSEGVIQVKTLQRL